MDLRTYTTITKRRRVLEEMLSVNLSHIGQYAHDDQVASARQCENMIGTVQIPIGVAGQISVNHQVSSIKYYVPLATTEGALVASVNRGCKAVTESGGVTVVSKKIGITRAPVFEVKNILEGEKFIANCTAHLADFKKIAETTSSHLALLAMRAWMVGKNVFLRFTYDTQDAMGMNMATIATSSIVSHIEHRAKVRCIALSGNMCVDKKISYLNFIEGRGMSVWADAVIAKKTVSDVLKTTPDKIANVWQRKVVYGSLMSGSIGANAHIANIIAAIFTATGQDLAHVGECSNGVTSIELDKEDLYISVYLPDMVVGTVGGGTGLTTQKEALSMLGISGSTDGKNAKKLAEIIGAVTLAGELSLLASLAEGTLATAHKKLGRGGK